MIAFDTNALVRMLIEDDKNQACIVQKVVALAEQNSLQIIILPEVLIETVWVLESIYRTRIDCVSVANHNLIRWLDKPDVSAYSVYKKISFFE